LELELSHASSLVSCKQMMHGKGRHISRIWKLNKICKELKYSKQGQVEDVLKNSFRKFVIYVILFSK